MFWNKALLVTAAAACLHSSFSVPAYVSLVVSDSTTLLANVTNIPYIGACDSTNATMSGFQAMLLACATSPVSIAFNYTIYPDVGVFVSSINGVAGDKDNYWSFAINGKTSSVGVDSVVLSPGDNLKWTFTAVTGALRQSHD